MDCTVEQHSARVATALIDMQLWHRRLGHRDPIAIRRLCTKNLTRGITVKSNCYSKEVRRAAKPLELVHRDLCGPRPTATPSRSVNRKTGRTWIGRSVKVMETVHREQSKATKDQEGAPRKETRGLPPETCTKLKPNRLSKNAPDIMEKQSSSEQERINKGVPPRRTCYRVEAKSNKESKSWDQMTSLPAAEKKRWLTAAQSSPNGGIAQSHSVSSERLRIVSDLAWTQQGSIDLEAPRYADGEFLSLCSVILKIGCFLTGLWVFVPNNKSDIGVYKSNDKPTWAVCTVRGTDQVVDRCHCDIVVE
ncbi:hypothetical protein TTRE_0000942301 [Trichuris trichiura]|uniref:GAG-pre-integrase domain-containing protein n=1 Tax=Trichuris trichiura TaxID=36087 RepID=A0A077ZKY7_TRITR|nr:hypothetical protein TTRE_0000942301 [Trichuris trichiura]